ncbi:11385_t:CDS:1, partial [Racocetra fulgida]
MEPTIVKNTITFDTDIVDIIEIDEFKPYVKSLKVNNSEEFEQNIEFIK